MCIPLDFRLNEMFYISSGYALTFPMWIENMIIENKFIGFSNNVYDDLLVDLVCIEIITVMVDLLIFNNGMWKTILYAGFDLSNKY